jgi:hypothetical protein
LLTLSYCQILMTLTKSVFWYQVTILHHTQWQAITKNKRGLHKNTSTGRELRTLALHAASLSVQTKKEKTTTSGHGRSINSVPYAAMFLSHTSSSGCPTSNGLECESRCQWSIRGGGEVNLFPLRSAEPSVEERPLTATSIDIANYAVQLSFRTVLASEVAKPIYRSLNSSSWTNVTVTWWYRTRRPIHCDHVWCIVSSLSSNYSRLIHQSSQAVISRHLVAKQEKLGEK